ncbi:VOC family protein [Vibrio fluvialis]|uniref:VOC family protein n=1 Tax=Vibrio fluvialis TaxID=676 RepID=UPI001F1D1BD6|nr:VOC family protein [Vibrio fluvialis]EKO3373805.1 VOC family protein [Vibrio fluvialis]ELE5027856.1 VOC family protein [Vibrio fluvialis]MCE7612096.1 VOC family protein [Vibrio fluvialis]MCE7618278.1 VOC family protein [Vibrio fluvialis]MCE7628698.1 VOC family protein [Vibrio fluvialis]
MFNLTPYLFFSGRCEQALEFYCWCFDGHVLIKRHFYESPQYIEGVDPNWVMHAELVTQHMKLMLSDGIAAQELKDNQIALLVVMDDLDQQVIQCDRLAEGGKVMMPLADTFWGTRCAKIEDQFGIRWIINCEFC